MITKIFTTIINNFKLVVYNMKYIWFLFQQIKGLFLALMLICSIYLTIFVQIRKINMNKAFRKS